MASEHTKESTRKYFQEHNYFGVNSDDVIFFEQHMLPCFTFDGKIILETPSKVARAPGTFHYYHWIPLFQHISEFGY